LDPAKGGVVVAPLTNPHTLGSCTQALQNHAASLSKSLVSGGSVGHSQSPNDSVMLVVCLNTSTTLVAVELAVLVNRRGAKSRIFPRLEK